MKFAKAFAGNVSTIRTEAHLSVFGQTPFTDVQILALRESSRRAPHIEVTVKIPNVSENFLEETSLLEQAYRAGQTVTPQPNTLTLTERVDQEVQVRSLTVYLASAEVTTDNEGRSATCNFVSIDGLMALMSVLAEGQSSEPAIFDNTRPIDEVWNESFSLDIRSAIDYHPVRAATGLDWSNDDAPTDSLSRLVIDLEEDLTYWQIASMIAQMFGRYVRQDEKKALAWTAAPFVRYDRPTLDLNSLRTIVSDVRATNTETFGDVIEFYWNTTILNDYGREIVERSRRIGRRSTVLGKVTRIPIQPRASTNTALLNRARDLFLQDKETRKITTLLDVTAEVGTRVKIGDSFRYIAEIDHDIEAGTTTLDLRSHYTLSGSDGKIWSDINLAWSSQSGTWADI